MPLNIVNPGSSGGGGIQVVQFTYATASPLVLQRVTAWQLLDRAVLVLTTRFDDPLPAGILLGTTATPGLVLGSGDVDASVEDQYENAALFEFAIDDFLQLTITPGASTQGAGFLFYRIK